MADPKSGPDNREADHVGGDGSSPADLPSGGYQRPEAEGSRAYDAGDLPRAGMTGQRGLGEDAVDEIAAPFDEDRILERVDRAQRGAGRRGEADERIRELIRRRLDADAWIDAGEIEVRVQAGEVTLAGSVDSRTTRRRAQEIAEAVEGVSYVENNLRARNPFYGDRDRLAASGAPEAPRDPLPTGAGSGAAPTSASGPTGTGTAGVGGDPLLGAEETEGRRRATAPVDGRKPGPG